MNEEITANQVDRKLDKIVAYTEQTRKEMRELESEINNLKVQLQQVQSENRILLSKTNAAMAMRGHGATT